MESFAVRCPVPEVFEMLRTLALKAGYTGNTTRVSDWFYIGTSGCIECGEGHAVRGRGGSMLDEISIESAISELTKPRPKPLMVGSHRVTVNQDRSVTVGCTTVPAEVCDEIERRRGAKVEAEAQSNGPPVVWFGSKGCDTTVWRCVGGGIAQYKQGNDWRTCSEVHTEAHMRRSGIPEITEAEARRRCPAAFQEAK